MSDLDALKAYLRALIAESNEMSAELYEKDRYHAGIYMGRASAFRQVLDALPHYLTPSTLKRRDLNAEDFEDDPPSGGPV